jgi:hypothetical protein
MPSSITTILVTVIREDGYKEVDSIAQQSAMRNLSDAYDRFFKSK